MVDGACSAAVERSHPSCWCPTAPPPSRPLPSLPLLCRPTYYTSTHVRWIWCMSAFACPDVGSSCGWKVIYPPLGSPLGAPGAPLEPNSYTPLLCLTITCVPCFVFDFDAIFVNSMFFLSILIQHLFLEIHTRAFLLPVLPSVTDSVVHTIGFMPPHLEQCVRHALILLLSRFFQQYTWASEAQN